MAVEKHVTAHAEAPLVLEFPGYRVTVPPPRRKNVRGQGAKASWFPLIETVGDPLALVTVKAGRRPIAALP